MKTFLSSLVSRLALRCTAVSALALALGVAAHANTVQGVMTDCGQGSAGLAVEVVRWTRIGMETENKPCEVANPIVDTLGSDTTDANGHFAVSFAAGNQPPFACSFSEEVRVTVRDGLTVLWNSPKKPVTPTVTFNREFSPGCNPTPSGDAEVRGTITACGLPADARRVFVTQRTTIGLPGDLPSKPCQVSVSQQTVGSMLLGPDGQFGIPFERAEEPVDACLFEDQIAIRVEEDGLTAFTSALRPASDVVVFDQEMYPECSPGSSFIRVLDESGQRVPDAEIFINGGLRGTTDSIGQLRIAIAPDDRLVARKMVHENGSQRAGHDTGSSQPWNYRAYVTSMPLVHDANGDSPAFEDFPVVDPLAIQELVVRKANTVIGFNLIASVEYDATALQLKTYRDRLLDTSETIFNLTDGQFLIERIRIGNGKNLWTDADIRIFANNDQPSRADLAAIFEDDGVVKMNPIDARFPGVLMHELGHYAFGVYDEYKEGSDWDPSNGSARCTLASDQPSGDFGDGGRKDSCIMRGSWTTHDRKFCSHHPDNPHVAGTRQGDHSCWSEVHARYWDPRWRLLTPVSRGAIVEHLPDSGPPLEGREPLPPAVIPVRSFIPLADWKPVITTVTSNSPAVCAGALARVTLDGSPRNAVGVRTRSANGPSLYQGKTKVRSDPDGTVTAAGEVPLYGLHAGDDVTALFEVGWLSLPITVETTPAMCASGVVPIDVAGLLWPAFELSLEPLTVDSVELRMTSGTPLAAAPDVWVTTTSLPEPVAVSVMSLGGETYEAVLTGLIAGEAAHVEVRATESLGGELEAEAWLGLTEFDERLDTVVTSADGMLEIVLPTEAMAPDASILMHSDAAPELDAGLDLFAGPWRATSLAGTSFQAPARVFVDLHTLGATTEERAERMEQLELWQKDAASGVWEPIAIERRPGDGLIVATVWQLSSLMLIEHGG